MNIKNIFSNKKFKNTFFTLVEILVVAGIIYGVMMLVINKINYDADKVGKTSQEEKVEKGTGNYSIQVNLAKNAVIVFETKTDKSKDAIKVFPASIGKELDKGKYTTTEKYSWVREDEDWHQYGVKFGNISYIQSVAYSEKYPYTLISKSYKNIGKKIDGNDILLYAKDAYWIYKNCKTGVKINIVKGSKTDKLPLKTEESKELSKYCGWDPTDPNKENPFNKVKKGKIAQGLDTIYVEKGTEFDYLVNFLVFDELGNDVTNKLKYKKIDTNSLGKTKITYSFSDKNGNKKKVTQKVEVIDTTPPAVSCSKKQFTYQVDGRATEDMNAKSNVKEIEDMVRKYVSVNEPNCTITVKTVSNTELMEGNFPVEIKAQDESGNFGSCQVMCEITVKASKGSSKNTPHEKIEEILKEREGKEETTNKEKETKKKEKKEEKTTKASEKNKEETKKVEKTTEETNTTEETTVIVEDVETTSEIVEETNENSEL